MASAQPNVSTAGQYLTVDGVVAEEGAILKVVGPDGFRLVREIGTGENVTVDLLGARQAQDELATSLEPGMYRYEVLSRPEGDRVSGQFPIGSVSPIAFGNDQPSDRVDSEPNSVLQEDFVQIADDVNDGVTVLDLDSDGAALDLHWALVNEEGLLTIRESDTNVENDTGIPSFSFQRGDGSFPSMGIGTEFPVTALDIQTIDPTINLTDTDGGSNWKLSNRSGDFVIEGPCESNCSPFERWSVAVIEEGSLEDSLVIDADGVGIGTDPARKLHVRGSDGATQLLVQEQSGAEAARVLADLQNNGVTYFRMNDTSPDGSIWTFQTAGPSFRFNKAGTGAAEVVLRGRNDQGGFPTLTVDGSISADNVVFTSTRASKTDFSPVDSQLVLEKVASLDISEWAFKEEANDRRHIGPIAEDFAETFGLGGSDSTVSMIDASGVAFAAIQGLYEASQGLHKASEEKDDTIARLEEENSELAERLDALEAAIGAIGQ